MRAGRAGATLPFSPAAVFPDASGEMEHLAPGKQPQYDDLGKKRPKSGRQTAWPDAVMEVTLLSSTFPNPSAPEPASPRAPWPSHWHGLQGKVCHISGK